MNVWTKIYFNLTAAFRHLSRLRSPINTSCAVSYETMCPYHCRLSISRILAVTCAHRVELKYKLFGRIQREISFLIFRISDHYFIYSWITERLNVGTNIYILKFHNKILRVYYISEKYYRVYDIYKWKYI